MEELVAGVRAWHIFSAEKGFNFNGFLLDVPGGPLIVDPPEIPSEAMHHFETDPPPQLILLTNRHHARATESVQRRLGIPVCAHEHERASFPFPIDRTVREGDTLPGDLRVIHLPGKTPGEIGLYWERQQGVVLLGDAIIGHPKGELMLLPDAVLGDPPLLRQSLQQLTLLRFNTLLLGDGESILSGAEEKVRGFLEQLS